MNIYTLERKDLIHVAGLIDVVVASFVGQPGYYTLASVDEDGTPVGVLQAYVGTEKEFGIVGKITYIFVAPNERENNVASELVLELMGILQVAGITVCEVSIPENEDTEILKYAFSSFGFSFEPEDEYPYYEIPLKYVFSVPLVSKFNHDYIKPLTKTNSKEFRYLIGELKKHDSHEILTDEISLNLEGWDQDVSCFYLNDKGCGAFLLRKRPSSILEPKYLSGFGHNVNQSILGMMAYGANAAKEKYPPDAELLVSGKNDNTKELIKKLYPAIKPKTMLLGRANC